MNPMTRLASIITSLENATSGVECVGSKPPPSATLTTPNSGHGPEWAQQLIADQIERTRA